MPTKLPRLNITLENDLMTIVTTLAKQEQKSVSKLAKELVMEALERREDRVLSALAEVRDTKKAKRVRHADAWQ